MTTKVLDPTDGVVTVPEVASTHADIEPAPRRREKAVSAGVAVAIAAIPGLIGLLGEAWRPLIFLSVFGAPGVAILGWRLVSHARRGSKRDGVGLAAGMGVAAYVLGVACFTLFSVVWSLAGLSDDLTMVLGPVAVFFLGLVFMLPSLLVTIPSAMIWVAVVRRLAKPLVGTLVESA